MEHYIKHKALNDQNNMLGKTMCWVLDKKILLGFISLATHSIEMKCLMRIKNHTAIGQFLHYGQFAAHKDYSHNDLGSIMLNYAIKTAYNTSMDIDSLYYIH